MIKSIQLVVQENGRVFYGEPTVSNNCAIDNHHTQGIIGSGYIGLESVCLEYIGCVSIIFISCNMWPKGGFKETCSSYIQLRFSS